MSRPLTIYEIPTVSTKTSNEIVEKMLTQSDTEFIDNEYEDLEVVNRSTFERYKKSRFFFEVLRPNAYICKARPSDAGYDILLPEGHTVYPRSQSLIPLGLSVHIPNHYVGFLETTSSCGKNMDILLKTRTIDSGYRGEIKALVYNYSEESVHLKQGERYFQLVITKILGSPYSSRVASGVLYRRTSRGFR